ncbi:mitofilin family membrane protein [Paracoccaceae bacterium]|nr:mitofilin family membrane protein [Paracoccaceae bacterium]
MTETSTKKNLKKKEDEPNKVGHHFNYALLLAVVSLALLATAFGILYFFFVEMKDLKAELNSKLSKNAFLSEKVKIESSQTEVLKLEKEFLLSKINNVNDLVKTNSEELERKISAAYAEDIKFKEKNQTKSKSENIDKSMSKDQKDMIEGFQLKYNSDLDLLEQRISQNEQLIEKNKKSISILRKSYENIDKKKTLEIGQELLILIEEFTEISYYALKNEIKADEKQGWRDWITSYLNTVFISRSTKPIDGDHTDAILSRIDHALKNGKLDAAKKEISNLSIETRELMKDWIRKLEKLIEVEDKINQ